ARGRARLLPRRRGRRGRRCDVDLVGHHLALLLLGAALVVGVGPAAIGALALEDRGSLGERRPRLGGESDENQGSNNDHGAEYTQKSRGRLWACPFLTHYDSDRLTTRSTCRTRSDGWS